MRKQSEYRRLVERARRLSTGDSAKLTDEEVADWIHGQLAADQRDLGDAETAKRIIDGVVASMRRR